MVFIRSLPCSGLGVRYWLDCTLGVHPPLLCGLLVKDDLEIGKLFLLSARGRPVDESYDAVLLMTSWSGLLYHSRLEMFIFSSSFFYKVRLKRVSKRNIKKLVVNSIVLRKCLWNGSARRRYQK